MRAALPCLIEQAKATDGVWRNRSTLHLSGLVEHAAFDPCWRSPVVLAAVRHLLGPDIVARPPHLRGPAPGYGAQQLHRVEGPPRDDTHKHATVIVPLVDFTAENGATRVLPGVPPEVARRAGDPRPVRHTASRRGNSHSAGRLSDRLLRAPVPLGRREPRP